MATVVLGAVGSLVPGIGTAVGAAIGAIADQQFLMPLLFPTDEGPPRAVDLPVAPSIEGGKTNLVLGIGARIPLPVVWATNAQDASYSQPAGKRGEQVVVRWLRNLMLHATLGPTTVRQIIAEGRRIWTTQLSYTEDTTARASGTLAPGLVITILVFPFDPFKWIVRIELTNTVDLDGTPYAGSPEVGNGQYDEGGTIDVKLGGNSANASSDPYYSANWGVEYSRTIDELGNGKLIVSQIITTGTANTFPGFPTTWASLLTTVSGFSIRKRVNAGTAVQLVHARVPADVKAFPYGAGTLISYTGTAKPVLVNNLVPNTPYYRQTSQITIGKFNTSSFGNRIPNFEAVASGEQGHCYGVVDQLVSAYAEITASSLDYSSLSATDPMLGMRVFAPFRIGTVLDQVMLIHNCYLQEGYGGTATAAIRYGHDRDVIEISGADANCRIPGAEFEDNDISMRLLSPEDRPNEVAVAFSDRGNAWQRGQRTWKSNVEEPTGDPVSIQLVDATLTPERAQEIADRIGLQAWSRIREAEFIVPWRLATIQTDDIVAFTSTDGNTYDVLVQEVDFDSGERSTVRGFVVDREAYVTADASFISDVPEVGTEDGLRYVSDKIYTDGFSEEPLSHVPLAAGAAELLPLSDDHAGVPGVYVWAGPAVRNLVFQGAGVFVKRDGSDCWSLVGALRKAATLGWVDEALASGSGYDETNTVDVYMQNGEPASTTTDLCADSANRYLIGSEVVGVVTVTAGDDYHYTFADLHRGMLGTTASAATHAETDVVVLLDDAVVFLPLSVEDIGTDVSIAIVPPGLTIDDVEPITLTISGLTCTPRAPADVTLSAPGGTALKVDWTYLSLRNARFLTPAQDPREAGDRIIARFWNSTIASISGDPDYEVEVDVLENSLTITSPGAVGLEGPDIAARVFVRSNEWGDGAYGEDEISQSYTPPLPVDVNIVDLADTPADYGSAGQVLVTDGSTEFVYGNIDDIAGAGDSVTKDVGTSTGTVAAGDDSRFIAATRHLALYLRRLALPELGTTGWTSLPSGSGTGFYSNQPQYNAEQRVSTILSTHILAAGGTGTGTNAIVARMSSLALHWMFDGFRFAFRTFCNTTSGIASFRIGMWGAAATPAATGRPGTGLWLEYDPATLGNSNLWLCCANGSTVTTSDTGIAFNSTQRVWVVEQTSTSLGKAWELVTSSSSTQATVASNLPSGSAAQDVTAFYQLTRDNAGGSTAKAFIPDFGLLPNYAGLEFAVP